MPNFSTKSTQSNVSLSWETTKKLLKDVKKPQTRQWAFTKLLEAYTNQIAAICRSTAWGRQWGFEDSYQEAVTHFFETALQTDNPDELMSYWNLKNAVSVGAAKNIYPISVSPYLARKLRSNSFSRNLDKIPEASDQDEMLDTLDWPYLRSLCLEKSTRRQRNILEFISQTPGYIPTITELAEHLNLSKESTQRAWNYFQNAFKHNDELIQKLQNFLGFDFLISHHSAAPKSPSETLLSINSVSLNNSHNIHNNHTDKSKNNSSNHLNSSKKPAISKNYPALFFVDINQEKNCARNLGQKKTIQFTNSFCNISRSDQILDSLVKTSTGSITRYFFIKKAKKNYYISTLWQFQKTIFRQVEALEKVLVLNIAIATLYQVDVKCLYELNTLLTQFKNYIAPWTLMPVRGSPSR